MGIGPARLAMTTRGGIIESEHYGIIVIADVVGRTVYAAGDGESITFFRSSAKPLQALTLARLGVVDHYRWTDEELAAVCASHSASDRHLRTVRSILAKADLTVDDLGCGPHPPIDSAQADRLIRGRRQPIRLHNNCSGKHAGMLAGCRHQGWETSSYLRPDHPLQQANLSTVCRLAEATTADVGIGVDGCGVPSFALSLRQMATAYARLANPEKLPTDDQTAVRRITSSMIAESLLVAGAGRTDTVLMTAGNGTVIAKGGAEGLQCIGLVGAGVGIAIKILDGSTRAFGVLICRLLELFAPKHDWSPVRQQLVRPILNTLGQPVGEIIATV